MSYIYLCNFNIDYSINSHPYAISYLTYIDKKLKNKKFEDCHMLVIIIINIYTS